MIQKSTMRFVQHCSFVVIDKFQRMVANNLEHMLQVARSMNVGVILANQSMQELNTRGTDLIPALEANCRFRQWFAVSSSDDRTRVVNYSGETLEEFETHTFSSDKSTSTVSHRVLPRLMQIDVIHERMTAVNRLSQTMEVRHEWALDRHRTGHREIACEGCANVDRVADWTDLA